MSNLRPDSSMADWLPAILKRDSESGVRLMHTAIFMARKDNVPGRAIALTLLLALRLGAQIVETPIAFDSAGKLQSLTPALVARFHLAPPVWPVTTDFVEARLYAMTGGETVLVTSQRTGTLTRYLLRAEERDAL